MIPTIPSIPVVSVRLIVSDANSRVLILQRAEDAAFGPCAWCLPGGKVDFGETAEEAARKELREETSLEPSCLTFLFYQDSLPPSGEGMHVINLYFSCTATGVVQLNEESRAYRWVTRTEVRDYPLVFRNGEALQRFFAEHQRAC